MYKVADIDTVKEMFAGVPWNYDISCNFFVFMKNSDEF